MSAAPKHRAPLRVLHVASGDLWFGAEAQMCALLSELQTRSDVTVAAAVMNPGELMQRLKDADVEVFAFDESTQNGLQILTQLRHVMRTWRANIVHTHRQKENVLGALAAWTLNIPSLRTVHGAAEHHVSRWQLHKLHKRLFVAADHLVAKHLQYCSVAVTDDLAAQLRSTQTRARIETINNGVDVAMVRQVAALGLIARPTPPPWQIAIVGRLAPVKRVDLFIAMAEQVVAQCPGAHVFHIIGDGPDRATLLAQAQRGAARHMIKFHGFQRDILPLMASMHALVNTSDHEGLPITALEALALDVKVIARAVGGLVPLLAQTDNALLVNSKDPREFATALLSALPPTPGPSSSAAFAPVPEAYTLRASVDRYLSLYTQIQGK